MKSEARHGRGPLTDNSDQWCTLHRIDKRQQQTDVISIFRGIDTLDLAGNYPPVLF
jgi:hypothetical protein